MNEDGNMSLWKKAGRLTYSLPVIGEPIRQLYRSARNLQNKTQSSPNQTMPATTDRAAFDLGVALREHRDLLESSVSRIEQRLEFVRIEMMYELQHRLADSASPGAHKVEREGRVINHDVLAAAGGKGYRINVGCGHKPLEGWINVDLRPLPGVDITATADNIPLPQGSCAAVTSAHLLEHFTEEDLQRRILPHWFALLQPGGTVRAIVPDAGSMMRLWAEGGMDFDTLRLITYGQQEYDGDFHFTMFTPASLGALLEKAGFVAVETVAEGRRNGLCLEFEVTARKPA
jgi:hypothetical protein